MSEYILSFDLNEVNRQITTLQNSYSNLSETFKRSSEEAVDHLDDVLKSITKISSSLEDSFMSMDRFYTGLLGNLKSTTEYFEKLSGYSKSVTDNLTKLNGVDLSRLRAGAPDDTAAERIAAIHPEQKNRFQMSMSITAESDAMAETALEKAEHAIKAAQKALKETKESEELILGTTKKISELVKKEVRGTKDSLKGIARKGSAGIAFGGGILTGLIGMMILGVQERQRLGAERGEMANVFESIGDMFSKESKKAVGWFSRFAENAQWYFGIGRKEVQSVVKQLVDSGYKSSQIIDNYKAKITDVEANVVTLTLGIDKHLEQASGTSMQNVVKLVTQYGDTLDSASEKYTKLAFAAQRSGIGVSKFIDTIMSGSSALTQYGIEMEDVVEVMGKMQKYYKSMGLSDQFAGDQASQAVKGIVSGIAGLDEGVIAALAQRMFSSLGLDALDAIQKFKEGAARVAAGEDDDFLIEAAKQLRQLAVEHTGPDRAAGIRFLQGAGLGHQQATALYDVADKLETGNKLQELSDKESKALRNAFKTEGNKLTELQKTQRSILKGLAKIGEGLLRVLTGILGAFIVMAKSIPAAIVAAADMINPMTRDQGIESFKKLHGEIEAQLSGLSGGSELMLQGAKQVGGAVGGALGDIGGNLQKAAMMDPGGHWQAMWQTVKESKGAIENIIVDNEHRQLWMEELQASFNKRINDIAVFTKFKTEEEVKTMEEQDRKRLQRKASRLGGSSGRSEETKQRILSSWGGILRNDNDRSNVVVEKKIEGKHFAKSIDKVKQDVAD